MAETSGEVVMVPTPSGEVEAQRMGRAEAGPGRWCVRYSWGSETFFGNSAELVAHVQRRVAETAAKPPGDAR
jgi:hypothetical protein